MRWRSCALVSSMSSINFWNAASSRCVQRLRNRASSRSRSDGELSTSRCCWPNVIPLLHPPLLVPAGARVSCGDKRRNSGKGPICQYRTKGSPLVPAAMARRRSRVGALSFAISVQRPRHDERTATECLEAASFMPNSASTITGASAILVSAPEDQKVAKRESVTKYVNRWLAKCTLCTRGTQVFGEPRRLQKPDGLPARCRARPCNKIKSHTSLTRGRGGEE